MAESLDPKVTALIIFDMQKGQFNIPDPERQKWIRESNIVANAVELVAAARKANVLIYYVRNNRRADGLDQPDVLTDAGMRAGGGRPGGGGNPQQFEIIDELKPQEGDFVVDKIKQGGFSGTALDSLLRARRMEHVIIAGVRTTVGVETTVRDGRDLGYNMVVASNATGGVSPEDHQWTLEKIFPQLSRVRTVAQIKEMLGQ